MTAVTVHGGRTIPDKGVCGVCGRQMYKTVLMVGVPTEWRHDSSGHAISWMPQRHRAMVVKAPVHAHKWVLGDGTLMHCRIGVCDSEVPDAHRATQPVIELSEKALHVAESRRRGGAARKRQTVKVEAKRSPGVQRKSAARTTAKS